MTRLFHIITFLCVLKVSVQRSTPQSDSYVAAVVEYQVSSNVQQNIDNYVQLIADAGRQNADIIVFPELTITSGTRAVTVPIHGLLQQNPIPALQPMLFDEILVRISEAARANQIYVVINVQEDVDCRQQTNEECPEARLYLFNTNVVFDRNGAVIDRYRKINLFGEFTRTPALHPDLGVFTTDFGVTFGHYICFDLMFQVPAVQVVQQRNITDVVFTTMWFSELPYLTAVQIQEAYAYAMDVNFLGSGANNVNVGSAGSGIYSGKAGALTSTMPGVPTTRLLVATVPKVPGQVTGTPPGPIYDNPTDHDSLRLITDPSLPAHITRPLVPGFQEFTLVDREISCRFRVRLSERNAQTRYNYRAAVLNGVRSFSGVANGGVRICSVISCTGDTIDTCGTRFPEYAQNTTAIFNELVITATVPTPVIVSELDATDSKFFPVSLDVSIMPLEPADYMYTEVVQNTNTVYTMTLRNTNATLYSFAIWGRVFGWDDDEASPPVDQNIEGGNTEETDGGTEGGNGGGSPEEASPDSSVTVLVNMKLLMSAAILVFFATKLM